MEEKDPILILGARGLLGSAIKRILETQKHGVLLVPTSGELNLLSRDSIREYLEAKKPFYIFMVAGLVGGIAGNNRAQADFLYQNALMILNLLEVLKELQQKKRLGMETKLLYTGSTCIYPREASQPLREESFLTGRLEETNIGYALAKITGIVACQKYHEQYGIDAITCMPTNLYGIGDNYNLETGHFLAALIKRMLLAKRSGARETVFWGSGKPRREALYNLDCADALVYLMKHYSGRQPVNIGTGWDFSIAEYVELMREITGYAGEVKWDTSKPDGTFQKKTDITRLKSIYPGFKARSFRAGVKEIMGNGEEVKRIFS